MCERVGPHNITSTTKARTEAQTAEGANANNSVAAGNCLMGQPLYGDIALTSESDKTATEQLLRTT